MQAMRYVRRLGRLIRSKLRRKRYYRIILGMGDADSWEAILTREAVERMGHSGPSHELVHRTSQDWHTGAEGRLED